MKFSAAVNVRKRCKVSQSGAAATTQNVKPIHARMVGTTLTDKSAPDVGGAFPSGGVPLGKLCPLPL
jgi:hypothetical protein